MEKISFTHNQQLLFMNSIEVRIESNKKFIENDNYTKADKVRFEKRHINSYISAAKKINLFEAQHYDNKEKAAMISCMVEFFDEFYKEIQDTIEFSNPTNSNKNYINTIISDIKDVLLKCDYYNLKCNKGKIDINLYPAYP